MTKIKLLRNSAGIGLIEVMAAIAITGGLSLTISKLMENQSQAVKQNEAKSENMNLKGIIQETLNNSVACKDTFLPITSAQWTSLAGSSAFSVTLPNIKDKETNIKYSTASTNIAPLTITSITLTNYNSGLSTGDLIIQSTFRRSPTVTQVVKPIKIPINFSFNPFPTTFSGCSTMAVGGEWMLGGNAATTPGTDYLGTSDAADLVFKTNATERARVNTTGNLGIASPAPISKLSVANGVYTAGSYNSDGYASATIFGYSDLADGTGVYGRVKPRSDNTRQTGVRGDCTGPNVSAYCAGVWGVGNYATAGSGRSYGVMGWNNANGTEGWNYATHGWLYGTRSGAAIFGSSDAAVGDLDVSEGVPGRRWAGYFNGNVKATGTLSTGTSTATGTNSMAMGSLNSVSGNFAMAAGEQNNVTGNFGFTGGFLNNITGEAASAFGKGNIVSGVNAHAVGEANLASGLSSFTSGYYNIASGAYAVALGFDNTASNTGSVALGYASTASGLYSFAAAGGDATGTSSVGLSNGTASGNPSFAVMGTASSWNAVAIGLSASAPSQQAQSFGSYARTYGKYSTSIGRLATTGVSTTPDSSSIGAYATAIGHNAQVTAGMYGMALSTGDTTAANGATVSGQSATAIGFNVDASSQFSMALGKSSSAAGNTSFVIGNQVSSTSTASNSLAIGTNVQSAHSTSIILGMANNAVMTTKASYTMTLFADNGVELCSWGSAGGACNSGRSATWSGGAWSYPSDRNIKKDFSDIDKYDVLKKINELKVSSWRYKVDDSSKFKRIGVMAQDYHKIFKIPYRLDGGDKTLDHSQLFYFGILGIQALTEEVEELKNEIAKLKENNSDSDSVQPELNQLRQDNKDLKEALCELHPELKICKMK